MLTFSLSVVVLLLFESQLVTAPGHLVTAPAVGPGPVISISVVPSTANPVLGGANYTLTCNVSGFNATIYQWTKNDSVIQGETAEKLSLSPFNLSNAGKYRCGYTRLSSETSLTILSAAFNVTAQIPSPTSVLIQSNPSSPIYPIGSDVSLLCTVVLSPAVDVPVIVHTVWSGPGFRFENIGLLQPVVGSTATYTTTATISSFGRKKSGNYYCAVLINSTNHDQLTVDNTPGLGLSQPARIITVSAPTMAPVNFAVEDLPASTKVQFSWDPPSNFITNYLLNCTAKQLGDNPVIMTYNDAGSHTLGGLRPATEYSCSVSASNSAGRGPSVSVNVTTLDETSLFQLRLTGLSNCPQWVAENTGLKLESIKVAVLEKTQELCQCGFISDRLTDEVFQCFPASPEAVTYRAMLHGTTNTTSAQLISHIEQWTAKGAAITIQQVLLRVDGSCAVAVSSLVDDECQKRKVRSDSFGSNDMIIIGSISGGVLATVILVVVIVTAVITAAIYVRKNKQRKSQERGNIHQTNQAYTLEEMGHQKFGPTDPLDHDYEHLDIYTEIAQENRVFQASNPSARLPNTHQYNITQCPAYGVTAHK